jgi:hypothetical protein
MAIKNAPSAPAPIEFVGCAMAGCPRKARVKVLRKVWLNLCQECHAQLTLTEAQEYCRSRGLHTREQMFAWIKQRLPRIGRSPQAVDDREPGADEREAIEAVPSQRLIDGG